MRHEPGRDKKILSDRRKDGTRLIGYTYFSPKCDSISQIHLKREDYNLANIPRMMSKIYADNFARSKSDSSRGSAERGVATQAIGQDLNNTNHLYCNNHKTATQRDTDCRFRPASRPNDNYRFIKVCSPSVPEICSSWDLPVRDDSDETSCISF